jgi:signal peptidase I
VRFEWKERLKAFWRDWVRPGLVVVLVLGSFRSAVADWNDVPSGSMRPTILEGDRVCVNRLAYDLRVPFTTWSIWRRGNPARGDIVVLLSPADGRLLVKRVVGVPGDELEIRKQLLFVNGERARYEPVDSELVRVSGRLQFFAEETVAGRSHLVARPTRGDLSFGPVSVPPDSYFIMGDNRGNSFDSRHWGFAPRSAILGRAVAIALSVDPSRSYRPRWERFFSGLS